MFVALNLEGSSLSLCGELAFLEHALQILNRIGTLSPIVSPFPLYLFILVFTVPLFSDSTYAGARLKRSIFPIAGQPINFDFAVADCVLPSTGRNHPAHIARGTTSR